MTATNRTARHLLLVLSLGLVGGCDRGAIHDEVEEMKEAQRTITSEVKEQLAHAKDEASRLKEKLPEADELKDELAEASAEAKAVLRRVGERVKRQAGDLTDALRERIADAD